MKTIALLPYTNGMVQKFKRFPVLDSNGGYGVGLAWRYALDAHTRNRHRKPVPENWYHKPARKYSMFYSLPETDIRKIRHQTACQTVPVFGYCTGFGADFW